MAQCVPVEWMQGLELRKRLLSGGKGTRLADQPRQGSTCKQDERHQRPRVAEKESSGRRSRWDGRTDGLTD